MSRVRIAALATVCSLIAIPAQAQLVTNGGFETGTTFGWTSSAQCSTSGVSSGKHSGSYGYYSGETGHSCTISQNIATTAGSQYTFSFWIGNGGGTYNSADVRWDGSSVYGLINGGNFSYQLQSFNVLATGAVTNIALEFRHDPSFYILDDVQVVLNSTVPEPATYALMGAGLLTIAMVRRRRRA